MKPTHEGIEVDYILGYDPGNSGGLVVLDSDGRPYKAIKYTPKLEDDLVSAIRQFQLFSCVAYIEQVNGNPKMSAGDAFKFGASAGVVRGAIKSLGIPVVMVTPQKWQGPLRLPTKSADREAHKNLLKEIAKEHFPMVQDKVYLWNADAYLIAEYGYKKSLSLRG